MTLLENREVFFEAEASYSSISYNAQRQKADFLALYLHVPDDGSQLAQSGKRVVYLCDYYKWSALQIESMLEQEFGQGFKEMRYSAEGVVGDILGSGFEGEVVYSCRKLSFD